MGNIRKEIFLKGKKRTDDIVSCVRKGRFYKITFKSHKTYTYYYDVKIVEPSKEELFIDNRLNYFRSIAEKVGLEHTTDKGLKFNILLKNYGMIEKVVPESILYNFLNGGLPVKENKHDSCIGAFFKIIKPIKNEEKEFTIFPFGFNISQKQAVDKALENNLSIIEGPPGTGKTQTILNIIANAVIRGESVAVVSSNNSATKNIIDKLTKYEVDFISAYLGNTENKEEFIKYADPLWNGVEERAEEYAINKVRRDFDQGWQGIEYKLNTVGSSRGDYPFVTVTIGLGTQRFEKMCNISLLNVHKGGQGRPGNKKPVLFPKIVFLYDEKLHGVGGECEDVFEAGVACSAKTMYPDWLSMTGKGYISSMYKQYKKVISPMGCRAFLSPWYERGGMYPADDKDVPVFTGRFNIGAVSLHLPMILAKARSESRDFYEVLDYYLEMIRNLHKRTYEYLGAMKASTNPLAYCEGGFYGGHLKPNERIKKLLKPMTASFGITALNELQELYNGKSITEDGEFALEVLEYINKKVSEFKEEDGWLYAIYGTPAESLCGLQVEQFRKKYGIVENVSDRPYVSNSFHCHVTEDITPIEKQDLEGRFWELCNGGKIQYVRYPIDYNVQAIKSLIRRAMDLGYYEGVNLSLAYCDDCGHQELEMDVCPKCGSKNLTKIDRMNGYLSYSRVHGDTRLNEAKMAEIAERKSM